MVVVDDPSKYALKGFEVDHGKKFKYRAVLKNKATGTTKKIPFGAKKPDGTPYEQYKDNVLGYYSQYDHNDKQRRSRYRQRHEGEQHRKYSSGYWSYLLLW